MEIELKPCPFCGSKRLQHGVEEHERGPDIAFIKCKECPAFMEMSGDSDGNVDVELKLANHWNRRE
jgi:transcription elongation factor Elf1